MLPDEKHGQANEDAHLPIGGAGSEGDAINGGQEVHPQRGLCELHMPSRASPDSGDLQGKKNLKNGKPGGRSARYVLAS